MKSTEDITSQIASRIQGAGETIANKVVDQLVDREITRRAESVIKALAEVETIERDLRKIKADQVFYDGDGKLLSESFSKAKVDERKKLTERLGKVRAMVDAALEKNDFGKLLSAGDKGGKPTSDSDVAKSGDL